MYKFQGTIVKNFLFLILILIKFLVCNPDHFLMPEKLIYPKRCLFYLRNKIMYRTLGKISLYWELDGTLDISQPVHIN